MNLENKTMDNELSQMSCDELEIRLRLLDQEMNEMEQKIVSKTDYYNEIRNEINEINAEISKNKTAPFLICSVVEVLDMDAKDGANPDESNNNDLNDKKQEKCVVIKTSTRKTMFLGNTGFIEPNEMRPGDLIAVNNETCMIMEKLPSEIDSRVKAMEIDEKPTEQYGDIGGLEKQIQELVEAVVLPISQREKFEAIGIQPPKGVIMYGPPGTGKTLLARACAAQTNATFLKLAGPQLVQMYIGDGAKLVREAFQLAKAKAPTIIFIDELDAIGAKRFDDVKSGDREVQRTMLELLNQLDGFEPNDNIKVIAATNRIDNLDPALLRSGRMDRKIEFPTPNEEARAKIMQIHSRTMNVSKSVNFQELSQCTEDFNGAQCKAVCVESAMIALRNQATEIVHEDFMDAILEVKLKTKSAQHYFS